MVADVRTRRKFGHKKEQAIAALLSHRNVDGPARAVTTPKTSAQTEAISPNQPENHAVNAAETPKTMRKTAFRTR
jgi:hypothetical protein